MKDDVRPQPAAAVAQAADPLWYRDAVIYELHVKAYADGNGDGIGDFAGLAQHLDHVQSLGVDTIWLLPFYPSPLRDDGYDVADYCDVHAAYGTLDDFRRFVDEAHRRGLRVITELVVNHTSDRHPWFQRARRAPKGSPERDFYVWSDDPDKYAGTRIIFTDTEKSNWAWDEAAQQYYWHRFFSHQPDLNFDNPAVLEAVIDVMEFWLGIGVDGFRLDAIPYLIERDGTSNENLRETHEVIKAIRRRIDADYPGRMLLAEANMWPEDVHEYFGDGDECHMAYHFPLMPRMYMAIAQEERHPIAEILAQTPRIPDGCQWAIFLRNHDELTLEMVTSGDEIGMGDNIFLGDRDGVRTPMQWTSDRNGGFSRADPQRLYLPPIQDPVYGFEAVNVEAQSREPSSLLNWTRRMLAVRASTKAFGRGSFTMLQPGNRKIVAYLREHDGDVILCVANMSRAAQPVELDLQAYKGRVPVEMLGRHAFPPIGELPYLLSLPGHGFFWFRLAADVPPPDWYVDRAPAEDLPVLVLFDGWNSFFRDRVVPWRIGLAERTRAQLEHELLPRFARRQRWFDAAGAVSTLPITDHAMLDADGEQWLLAIVDEAAAPAAVRHFLPLSLVFEDAQEERVRALAPVAVSRVRQQAAGGVLAGAMGDERFCRVLVEAIGRRRELPTAAGRVRFVPTAGFDAVARDALAAPLPLTRLAVGRNAIRLLGDQLVLKAYRQLEPWPVAELEMGRHLNEVGYRHVATTAGHVEYVGADGTVCVLALLQAQVQHQGDAWSLVVDALGRLFEQAAAEPTAVADGAAMLASRLGALAVCVAELHLALARPSAQPAFDPEPVRADDVSRWVAGVESQLERMRSAFDGAARRDRDRAGELLARARAVPANGLKTRVHGDLQLPDVLLSQDRFVLIDFEADASAPQSERCAKHSPLRDVAALRHSLFLAARAARRQVGQADSPWLDAAWRDALPMLRDAFVRRYADAAVAGGLWADHGAFDAQAPLLDLFEFERPLERLRRALERGSDDVADAQEALAAWLAATAPIGDPWP
ncbi:MAG: alpha-amylase family glycosyl hydrolase [Burkholderiaceae bacterium]|nr:alpha-amylase family glycosyl hydrolase [Burkholderiaceae bacterium]